MEGNLLMWKKIIAACLAILLFLPLPAMAGLSEDVREFEQRYPEIYGEIDPALMAKMESFLQDVVNDVVANYDSTTDLNGQVNSSVMKIILQDPRYNQDLLPFLMSQLGNKENFRSQISEMKAIVSRAVQVELDKKNPPASGESGSGNGNTDGTPNTGGGTTGGNTSGGNTSGGGGSTGGSSGGGTTSGSDKTTTPGTTTNQPEGSNSSNSNSAPTGQAPELNQNGTTPAANLNDIQGHWAETAINSLVNMKIVSGDGKGTFHPDDSITREQFVVLLAKAAKLPIVPDGQLQYNDAGQIAPWARDYVAAAVKAGIISGYEDGTFRGQNKISRAEIAVMIIRSQGQNHPTNTELSFNDSNEIPAWARDAVSNAVQQGIISGFLDGTFRANAPATRAQSAMIIWRMIQVPGT
jgi:hypothetical protein